MTIDRGLILWRRRRIPLRPSERESRRTLKPEYETPGAAAANFGSTSGRDLRSPGRRLPTSTRPKGTAEVWGTSHEAGAKTPETAARFDGRRGRVAGGETRAVKNP